MSKYKSACASLHPGQLDRLTSKLSDKKIKKEKVMSETNEKIKLKANNERSKILDIVDHTPERLYGENFKTYQKRRRMSQATIKLYLQGERIQ